jgi:1-deoxy-D-xylulose-5-phosphate synthase
VVAIYSTFLNRAFDQLLMDVSLLNLPVTLVLDRAGVTGSDGASHNGVWDMAICGIVPGIHVAAPRDGEQLKELFREAVEITSPTVLRFPKGDLPDVIEAQERLNDGVEIIRYSDTADSDDAPSILLVAAGIMVSTALKAAEKLEADGFSVTVVDPRWVMPVAPSVVAMADDHDLVVTIEDGIIHGGVGSMVVEALNASSVDTPVRNLAFPETFPMHQSRSELLAEVGLDANGVTSSVEAWVNELFLSEQEG